MSRKLLIPIVALAAFVAKQYTGVEYTTQELDVVVEGVLALIILSGIFMNPKK